MDFKSQTLHANDSNKPTIPPTQLDFDDLDSDPNHDPSNNSAVEKFENNVSEIAVESNIDSIDSDFYSSMNSDCNSTDSVILGYSNKITPPIECYKARLIETHKPEEQHSKFSIDPLNTSVSSYKEKEDFTKNQDYLKFKNIGTRRHSTESEVLRELKNYSNKDDYLRFTNYKNKKLKLEKDDFTKSLPQPNNNHRSSPPRGLQRMKSLTIHSSSNLCNLPSLPIIYPQTSPIHHITPSTVISLLKGAQFPSITDFVLIDCRFNYEIKGGSIINSNYCRTRKSIQKLYEKLKLIDGNIAVIFYCEFSRNRSPTIASYFRQLDRLNSTYPKLTFPDTYILEGGYKGFWEFVNEPKTIRNERKIEYYSTNNKNVNISRINGCDKVLKGKLEDDKRKWFSIYGYVSMWDNNYKRKCNKKNRNMKREWSKSVVNGIL